MKLQHKGPIVSPPTLSRAAERVAVEVRSWPGIVCAAHWFGFGERVVDGTDFYVGEVELGHIHLDGELHLAASRPLRNALVTRGFARPAEWDPAGPWVVTTVRRAADVARGLWLFRLNYARIRGAKTAALVAAIAAGELTAPEGHPD